MCGCRFNRRDKRIGMLLYLVAFSPISGDRRESPTVPARMRRLLTLNRTDLNSDVAMRVPSEDCAPQRMALAVFSRGSYAR